MYTKNEVIDYVREEDVKFIRLAFTDVHGNPKNISVMPGELPRAFSEGISFDASAIEGFGGEVKSDLFLVPDPATLSPLPWRPSHGRVVRMFCDIRRPDGTYFEGCSRVLLRNAAAEAKKEGLSFGFGAEMEFYLFETDEEGKATDVPFDRAGYMDMAPDDRGENVRREICLTLDEMGIIPESSHHEEGPGQNEIDFRYSDPLSCADNVVTVKTVVKTVAAKNGLFADFSPKPLSAAPGSGMHVNMSVQSASPDDASALRSAFLAGILAHIREITLFLNPKECSYDRLGKMKAPKYVTYSSENRSQLVRIPAAKSAGEHIELRSPDALADPYLAFALLIYAGLDGIENGLVPPAPTDADLYSAEAAEGLMPLPRSVREARALASDSAFVAKYVPVTVRKAY